MKILFALPGLHRFGRGAEVVFESVAQEIALRGDHQVTLVGSGEARSDRAYEFIHLPAISRDHFEVSAVASTRCVAGKVVVVVKTTNGAEVPVEYVAASAYGTATATLAVGASVTKAFSTRAASIDAGAATITEFHERAVVGVQSTAGYDEGRPLGVSW